MLGTSEPATRNAHMLACIFLISHLTLDVLALYNRNQFGSHVPESESVPNAHGILKKVGVKDQEVQVNSLEAAFREQIQRVERQLQDLIILKHTQVGMLE